MTRHVLFRSPFRSLSPAAAQDKPAAPQAPAAKMQNLLQNCDAHKFETTSNRRSTASLTGRR